ncbi:hypothetical protein B0H14DRAFT_2564656 [Mycena olivaceomarginata]|nr:hypothetical protein B0H14DRAFT_2606297 [Mycena olivaceomarginata]KAJ7883886.1 hypothetical protein B0H14DRAFT_2564656 [Mycena olivaceomarginata]
MDEQELQRLRSENADYVKQLEENKAELDKTFEASTADPRFHQEGHCQHDDVMNNLADNDRTKIWSGGGEGPAYIVGEENLHFDGKWSECGPGRFHGGEDVILRSHNGLNVQ